jgi:hypothetical protein
MSAAHRSGAPILPVICSYQSDDYVKKNQYLGKDNKRRRPNKEASSYKSINLEL